jgi:hypothetical protein
MIGVNLAHRPSGKWQKCLSISRAERVTKSDVSDKFGTDWSEAEIGGELRPHGTRIIEGGSHAAIT